MRILILGLILISLLAGCVQSSLNSPGQNPRIIERDLTKTSTD